MTPRPGYCMESFADLNHPVVIPILSPGAWVCLVLLVLAILLPNDAALFPAWLLARYRLEKANLMGYIMGRRIHRKMVLEAKERGLPAPAPFKFVRFEKRKLPRS